MTDRTAAPPGASARLTDEEHKDLSRKVKEANRRSEQGGGQR